MRICLLGVNPRSSVKKNNCQRYNTIPISKPLACDTITFGAMKKSQFEGLDFAVVEKFKAPIQSFNSDEDFKNWIKEKIDELTKKDYGARMTEARDQRKALLDEWFNYIKNENTTYSDAAVLLIIDAITKGLEFYNNELPPALNKGVLADCIFEIENRIKADRKYQFNLNKMYQTKLMNYYLEDSNTGETETKWIVIPSKDHDPEHFQENVKKLRTLSYKSWCTKSFSAEPYLKEGDFHIFLKEGRPKLCIRFVGDKIEEIQGELNNSRIPIAYFGEVEGYVAKNGFKSGNNAKREIEDAKIAEVEVKKIKKDLKEAIENNDEKAILEYFNFKPKEDEEGFLTISEYKPISESYSFEDIGIDENWLVKKVRQIESDADFINSKARDLGNLKYIGANACFQNSEVENLSNLERIEGCADFRNSKVKDLGKLKYIGSNAYFENSRVENLDSLEFVGGFVNFFDTQVKDLKRLLGIGTDI